MFLSNIKKGVFDFIIWKFIGLKGVLIVAVLNDLIGVPLPNLILAFSVREVFICGWSGYFLIRARY